MPVPATIPSAGTSSACPNRIFHSKNVPGSRRRSILSRAVSFPALCCLSILLSPPPEEDSLFDLFQVLYAAFHVLRLLVFFRRYFPVIQQMCSRKQSTSGCSLCLKYWATSKTACRITPRGGIKFPTFDSLVMFLKSFFNCVRYVLHCTIRIDSLGLYGFQSRHIFRLF